MSDYNFQTSIKSDLSDELLNTYLLRPVAGIIVRVLYHTSVTPNQVTVASIVAGLAAAGLYWQGTEFSIAVAGIAVTLKDLLDSADGQLARAKKMYSRRGRFLDSLGDIAVNASVFFAIGHALALQNASPLLFLLAFLGFAGITLRVSYHVFYQASYLHLEGKYEENRIVESIAEEDLRSDPGILRLQRVFLALYGWQDRLMVRLDGWCQRGSIDESSQRRWYADAAGLRLSGLLGFGTELFLLTVCSLADKLLLYLILNVVLMNGILCGSVVYRRVVLRRKLTSSGGIS